MNPAKLLNCGFEYVFDLQSGSSLRYVLKLHKMVWTIDFIGPFSVEGMKCVLRLAALTSTSSLLQTG